MNRRTRLRRQRTWARRCRPNGTAATTTECSRTTIEPRPTPTTVPAVPTLKRPAITPDGRTPRCPGRLTAMTVRWPNERSRPPPKFATLDLNARPANTRQRSRTAHKLSHKVRGSRDAGDMGQWSKGSESAEINVRGMRAQVPPGEARAEALAAEAGGTTVRPPRRTPQIGMFRARVHGGGPAAPSVGDLQVGMGSQGRRCSLPVACARRGSCDGECRRPSVRGCSGGRRGATFECRESNGKPTSLSRP